MAYLLPMLRDVQRVCTILVSLRLPMELVLCILDEAHYWVEVETSSRDHVILADGAWSLDYSATYPYLYVPAYHKAHAPLLKIREIEFTIVSHDQGWTTEDTQGTYQTSSWFEASIIRPKGLPLTRHHRGLRRLRDMHVRGETVDGICAASEIIHSSGMVELVRRPSPTVEPQRLHCAEMINTKSPCVKEGERAWYIQGNEVAREKSVFEGEMVKRYQVIWGCKDNPLHITADGAGNGDGFIDTLEQDDFICVWARVKVSSTTVPLQDSTKPCIALIEPAETRLGESHPWCSDGHSIHDLAFVKHYSQPLHPSQATRSSTTSKKRPSMKVLYSDQSQVSQIPQTRRTPGLDNSKVKPPASQQLY